VSLFVIRKTLIDTQQLTMHNRQFQMASTDLHGMRKQFSFLRVLDSQQVTWVVKECDARKYLKRSILKKNYGVLDVLYDLKNRQNYRNTTSVRLTVTYYRRWNYLWDFHEIRCRCYLKKTLSKRDFCENRFGSSHTLLKGVNVFLTVLYVFLDRDEWSLEQIST
jgi:hypothetical protein